jgi:hypothetical protein
MSDAPSAGDLGDRVHIGEIDARGARSVGLIWMLIASLVAIVVVLAAVLAYFDNSLAEANRHGGPGAVLKADAAKFHTPATPPPPVQ